MTKKAITIAAIVAVSIIVGGILGYVWGYSNVRGQLRRAYLSNALGNLALQIPALKEVRLNKSISADQLGNLESLALADVLIVRGLNPDVSKLNISQVSALCGAESYFHNYGTPDGENKRAKTLAIGYLTDILPNLQLRLKEVGTSMGRVNSKFRAAMERKYHHPFPDKSVIRDCLQWRGPKESNSIDTR